MRLPSNLPGVAISVVTFVYFALAFLVAILPLPPAFKTVPKPIGHLTLSTNDPVLLEELGGAAKCSLQEDYCTTNVLILPGYDGTVQIGLNGPRFTYGELLRKTK